MAGKLDSFSVVLFGFLLFGIMFGSTRSLGVFFIHFQDNLGASASAASLAISLSPSIMSLFGPIAGMVYNTIGPRKTAVIGSAMSAAGVTLVSLAPSIVYVHLVFGFLTGPGLGMVTLSVYSIVGQAFSEKRSLANNAITSSVSCISFVIAPIMQALIDEFSWRGALLVIGGIMANGIPSAILLTNFFYRIKNRTKKATPEDKTLDKSSAAGGMSDRKSLDREDIHEEMKSLKSSEYPKEEKNENEVDTSPGEKEKKINCLLILQKLFDKDLVADWCFWLFCVSVTTQTLCLMINSIYAVRYAQSIGMTDYQAVMVASVTQAIVVIVSPISGFFTSYSGPRDVKTTTDEDKESSALSRRLECCASIHRSWLLALFMVITGLVYLIPAIFTTYTGIIIYSISMGFAQGLVSGLPYTVLADFFGTEKLPNALGIRSLLVGIVLLAVPPLLGRLVDSVGNYNVVFYFASSASMISAILVVVVQLGISRRRRVQR